MNEPRLVGRRLPGVSIGSVKSRFEGGVPLEQQVDEAIRQASPVHLPAIAPRNAEGVWGVYCLACSDAVQDYVYPCAQWLETPPPLLSEYVQPPSEN